jgi:hypothetical protein
MSLAKGIKEAVHEKEERGKTHEHTLRSSPIHIHRSKKTPVRTSHPPE